MVTLRRKADSQNEAKELVTGERYTVTCMHCGPPEFSVRPFSQT